MWFTDSVLSDRLPSSLMSSIKSPTMLCFRLAVIYLVLLCFFIVVKSVFVGNPGKVLYANNGD